MADENTSENNSHENKEKKVEIIYIDKQDLYNGLNLKAGKEYMITLKPEPFYFSF